jgi:WD40 repeat protein
MRPNSLDQVSELSEKEKAKVFISYSRKDMNFADQLDVALKARGFEPLIDRTDIYAFEEWWKRVEDLIVRADTIIFVLSPDAVRPSSVSLKEVAFAASLNKRFAPIVFRPVQDKDVPEALAKLNFIFFDDPAHFEQSADTLAVALNTDISWIRQHTEFGEQARRWAQASKPNGLLLRPPVLEQAERWIASRPRGAPAPTEETQLFIRHSRQATTRRRNTLTGSLAAGLVLAMSLAGLAYWQRGIAVEQRSAAEQNASEALRRESLLLTELSRRSLAEEKPTTAALLALEGLPDPAAEDLKVAKRPFVPEAHRALVNSLQLPHETAVLQDPNRVISATFDPESNYILTVSGSTIRVWDRTTKELVRLIEGNHEFGGKIRTYRSTIAVEDTDPSITVYNKETGAEMSRVRLWYGSKLTAVPLIVVEVEDRPALYDLEHGSMVCTLPLAKGTTARLSRSGNLLAAYDSEYQLKFIFLFDTKSCALLLKREVPDVNESVIAFDFIDGMAFIGLSDGKLLGFSLQRETTDFAVQAHKDEIVHIDADQSELITAARNGEIKRWSIIDGNPQQLGAAVTVDAPIDRVLVSPSRRRVVIEQGSYAPGFVAPNLQHSITIININLYFGAVRKAQYETILHVFDLNAEGTLALISPNDNTTRILSIESYPLIGPLTVGGHKDLVPAFSPNGTQILTRSDEEEVARIWSSSDGTLVATLKGHSGAILDAQFSSVGAKAATGSADKKVLIWNTDGWQPIVTLPHTAAVNLLRFSLDDKILAVRSEDNAVSFWDADTWKLTTVVPFDQKIIAMEFYKDNERLIILTEEAKVYTLSLKDKSTQYQEVANPLLELREYALVRGGNEVFLASQEAVFALNVATGDLRQIAKADTPYQLTVSKDGKFLGYLTSKGASIYDLQSNVFLPPINVSAAHSLAFDQNARLFVGMGCDADENLPEKSRVKIFMLPSGNNLAELTPLSCGAEYVIVSPTGDRAVSYDESYSPNQPSKGTLLWRIFSKPDDLIMESRQIVGRCLTPNERKQFLLDPAPPTWCIIGGAAHSRAIPSAWKGIWPYTSDQWKNWLIARERGSTASPPDHY